MNTLTEKSCFIVDYEDTASMLKKPAAGGRKNSSTRELQDVTDPQRTGRRGRGEEQTSAAMQGQYKSKLTTVV